MDGSSNDFNWVDQRLAGAAVAGGVRHRRDTTPDMPLEVSAFMPLVALLLALLLGGSVCGAAACRRRRRRRRRQDLEAAASVVLEIKLALATQSDSCSLPGVTPGWLASG